MQRKILVLVGASGVGKTTVADRILNSSSDFSLVRSVTTRAPRGDGRDDEYIYIDRAEFSRRIKNGGLVEYTEYGDNLYGTPISELERIFAEGKIPLLILDVEGVRSLRNGNFDFRAVAVYLWDTLDTVEKRLSARDLSAPDEKKLESFKKRIAMNLRDYRSMPDIAHLFDMFVRNGGRVEDCAKKITDAFFLDLFDPSEKLAIANSLYEMASSK